jgi:hypothetical protein
MLHKIGWLAALSLLGCLENGLFLAIRPSSIRELGRSGIHRCSGCSLSSCSSVQS